MNALKALLLSILLWTAASACGGGQGEVFVFAASSLTDVMERLGDEFEEQRGIEVTFSFGASGSLAQQIDRGAPADAFIAAGAQPMDFLEEKGQLAPGTRRDLLTNSLVVVIPAGAEAEIASLQDLLEEDLRVAIADPDLAPAGQYAQEALVNLGLWEGLKDRLVYGANVRTTLAYVESENVDAALVYGTDASITANVRQVAVVPEESHTPIRYPGAVVKVSDNRALAEEFLAFLTGEEAASIFAEHGFTPARGSTEPALSPSKGSPRTE